MKELLTDILFVIGLVLIFIPLFRFDVDIGLFVSGLFIVISTFKLSKKGGNDT